MKKKKPIIFDFAESPATEPCVPSPCGPNSVCHVQGSGPVCRCNRGMIGAPPNCRPECLIDQDCPSNLACGQNNKCSDPCVGTCGLNSRCFVHNHRPECQCYEDYEGDPFSGCIGIHHIFNVILSVENFYW